MTWQRAGGPRGARRPADFRRPRAARRRQVTPAPMGIARALVQGAAAVTRAAAVAAVLLLLGTVIVGLLVEELVGDPDIELLARGALVSLGVLVLIGLFGEPPRIALEPVLLARDAERMPAGTTPPEAEREALRTGPHAWLQFVGFVSIVVGGIGLLIGLFIAADGGEQILFRLLAVTVPVTLLAVGVSLMVRNRTSGPARADWSDRYERLRSHWAKGVEPVPRAHARQLDSVVGLAGLVAAGGSLLFIAGVFMRQPGRLAEPRTWDALGERTIDGLLTTGAVLLGVAAALALVTQAVLLLRTASRRERTVRALERGEPVLLARVDAVLLDRSPLARAALSLGVLGWLVASYGWAPTFIAGIESLEETADIQPLTVLAAPGLGAVAVGWALGSLAALRGRAHRARVQAVLLRDPQRGGDDDDDRGRRRATVVRDFAAPRP